MEAVFPVDCGVEAVPGLWTTGARRARFVLLAAQELDHTLEPGDVVAEVRSGPVETAACDCGVVETNFFWRGRAAASPRPQKSLTGASPAGLLTGPR